MNSKADQIAAMVSALNYFRCARQVVEPRELPGAVDVIDEASAKLRAYLSQLSEEAVSVLPIPELMRP